MARAVRNPKMDTRTARASLSERREPYWTVIAKGCAIGYRRGAKGGTWLARFRDDTGKQHHEALGAADDARDPDGRTVFSFNQAQERARAFFAKRAKELSGEIETHAGPYTVALALDDYFAARTARGSKGVKADRHAADARIVPKLGTVEVAKLTTRQIREWHVGLAAAARLVRSKKGAAERATKNHDEDDPDAVRARRATANRVLTVLKAALNHSYHEKHAASDEAWRKVKPFREVDAAVVRFLKADECVRLVNACDPAFRSLVRGALVTGARYGELARMRADDFHAEGGTVAVRTSKAGKPRHVALTDEGRSVFEALTAGQGARTLVFRRDHDEPWKASQQQKPLDAASKRAGINPSATFHVLRHTYASALAMKGVPMGVIAAQLGHADTRITEKHYAHLAPSYVAETVRAALPAMGIIEPSSVVSMTLAKNNGKQ